MFQGRTDVKASIYPSYHSNRFQGKIVPARGPGNFGEESNERLPPFANTVCEGWDPIFEYEGKT